MKKHVLLINYYNVLEFDFTKIFKHSFLCDKDSTPFKNINTIAS